MREGRNPEHLATPHLGKISWIPAFAGMTVEEGGAR